MYIINKNINPLSYLTNKKEFEWDTSYEISNGLWHIIPFLEKAKINYRVEKYWHYMMIDLSKYDKSRKNHFVYDGNYGLNDSVVNKIFDDKIVTTKVLSNNNIKTPKELLLIRSESIFSNNQNDLKSLSQFTKQVWYPIICKPLSDMQWNGVMKINNDKELEIFWDRFDIWEFGNKHYIAQQYIEWKDCRVLYLDHEVLIAYERKPAVIVWDGINNISQLIMSNPTFEKNIDSIFSYLYNHGYSTDDILEDKQILQILPTANLSTWGTAKVINLTEDDKNFVKKIAHIRWARYFGLDIMYQDSISWWYVIEINKSPGIMGISSIDENFPKTFWQKILDAIIKDQ